MARDLTSYMDETGHSDDPKFHFAGMAGFVAPAEAWDALGETWQKVLDILGVKEPFHMKDFAHSTGQFSTWKGDETRRRMLLCSLVQTILYIHPVPIGAVISIEDYHTLTEMQQGLFKDPYYIGFQICTRGAAVQGMGNSTDEKVAMVYSYQQEFGATKPQEVYSVDQAGTAEKLWHAIKDTTHYGKWMGAYSSSTPAELVQLQAADLFAYELAKEFENLLTRPNDSMRWGLRQILSLVNYPFNFIRLFDRKELLRLIKESNGPDQTGVEEIGKTYKQQLSAQERMLKWLRERGGLQEPYAHMLRDLKDDEKDK